MPPSDGCQINDRRGGEQEADEENGDKKMGSSEGQRKIEHGENKWMVYHCLQCRGKVTWKEEKRLTHL